MQKNCSRQIIISGFMQAILALLVSLPVVAQTADTVMADTAAQTATATPALSPLKKQVSDVARLLVQQQQYYTLDLDTSRNKRCRIERWSPVYKLPGGESRAALFMLPDYTGEYLLTIRSMRLGINFTWRIFVPTVVFLDSLYRPTRLLPERQFSLVSPGGFQGMSLSTELRMKSDNRADKYVLIFTMKSGKRVETYSDGTTLAPVTINHPVEGSPDGKIELELHRN